MKINTVLHTKDGRKIGNAIVIGNANGLNTIKTDYGTELKLTDKEIFEFFYIAYLELDRRSREFYERTHKNAVSGKTFKKHMPRLN